jgi:hypothetical protein
MSDTERRARVTKRRQKRQRKDIDASLTRASGLIDESQREITRSKALVAEGNALEDEADAQKDKNAPRP